MPGRTFGKDSWCDALSSSPARIEGSSRPDEKHLGCIPLFRLVFSLILRRVFPHSLARAALMGLLVWLQSGPLAWMVP